MITSDEQIKLKQSLIDIVITKLTERGDTNINISNIKIIEDEFGIYAFADVSYTWQLNATTYYAVHEDTLFIYKNGEWSSSFMFLL